MFVHSTLSMDSTALFVLITYSNDYYYCCCCCNLWQLGEKNGDRGKSKTVMLTSHIYFFYCLGKVYLKFLYLILTVTKLLMVNETIFASTNDISLSCFSIMVSMDAFKSVACCLIQLIFWTVRPQASCGALSTSCFPLCTKLAVL